MGEAPGSGADRFGDLPAGDPLRIGVLASQGGFATHIRMLEELGARAVPVRTPEALEGLDALVIPGGESTTISRALERDSLVGPIKDLAEDGTPILGTCAGMIICARNHLGLVDAHAHRNAWGRQIESFEAELDFDGIGPEPIKAVFIRAPWLTDCGPDVRVLASWEGHPVAVEQDNLLLCAFHPELTEDSRVHALLMAKATAARERARTPEEAER